MLRYRERSYAIPKATGMDSLLKNLRSRLSTIPPAATDRQLEDFEEELGRRLPRALRALYEDHNGEYSSGQEYRLLALHECYRVSEDIWCFWEWRLDPTSSGAHYHFKDGSVESCYQSYPGIIEFLQEQLESPLLLKPPTPKCLIEAERLDCEGRRVALLSAFQQLELEHASSVSRYLEDHDEEVVAASCAWLAHYGEKSALLHIAHRSQSQSPIVRSASLQAVEKMGAQLWAFRGDEQMATEVTAKMDARDLQFYQEMDFKLFLLAEPGGKWEFISGSGGPRAPLLMPESVRQRPGMFFGRMDGWGCHHLAVELIANSVDQFLAGHASQVNVKHDEWNLVVEDDGEGYPLDSELGERFLTSFHDSATSDGHAPHIHLVTRGVGLAPVNAVCLNYTVESIRAGRGYRLACQRGRLESHEEAELDFERGTRVRLTLDREIWEKGFEAGPLRRQLFDFVHLVPGLKVRLNDEKFYAPRGLLDLAEFVPESIGERRYGFSGQSSFLILQLAAAGESQGRIQIESWVNGAITEKHGSHVEGALEALEEIGWRPARLMVHVIMCEPRYAGPVKKRLEVTKALREVRALLRRAFEQERVYGEASTNQS